MKILVLRFSSIGDIVLTTPVIRTLKKQLGAEVHFLTKQRFVEILTPNPYIDRVIGFNREVNEVLPALKQEKYDYIIDLHRNLRSLRVKLALGRRSFSFPKLNWKKWLLVRFKIDKLPRIHIVDRYFETVRPLGVNNDGAGLDHFIPSAQEVRLEDWSPILHPQAYIALVLGATHATKRLPTDKLQELCKHIPYPVALLGGPDEAQTGTILEAPGIINLAGKLSLHQSASVIQQAKLIITHDTGLMHMAAALQKPIISIWGNTVPEFGMFPYFPLNFNGKNRVFEIKNLPCRPCSKIGYAKCPQGHFKCMREQPIDSIAQAID